MKRRLLASAAALTISSLMVIAAGPAWGQSQAGGCDSYEGDHGRDCLPAANDECEEDGVWTPFDVLEDLFEYRGWCAQDRQARQHTPPTTPPPIA